jgi:DUF971 family protein
MSHPQVVELNLHKLSKVLEVEFDDGNRFRLPCEYLRVYSPSAEVQGHGPGQRTLQVGKEAVGIDHIEPTGNYGVTIHFDDGHNTGIYSWQTLYTLGKHYDSYWAQYLQELEAAGHKRKQPS